MLDEKETGDQTQYQLIMKIPTPKIEYFVAFTCLMLTS